MTILHDLQYSGWSIRLLQVRTLKIRLACYAIMLHIKGFCSDSIYITYLLHLRKWLLYFCNNILYSFMVELHLWLMYGKSCDKEFQNVVQEW